jgi:hypothetical protein
MSKIKATWIEKEPRKWECSGCGTTVISVNVPHERMHACYAHEPATVLTTTTPVILMEEEIKSAVEVLGYSRKNILHWADAIKKWYSAGMPCRTKKQIEEIVKICNTCERFDTNNSRCSVCGCHINNSRWAIFNKAKMGTEQCDDTPPKWLQITTTTDYKTPTRTPTPRRRYGGKKPNSDMGRLVFKK